MNRQFLLLLLSTYVQGAYYGQAQAMTQPNKSISITINAEKATVAPGEHLSLLISTTNLYLKPYCTDEIREHDHAEINGYNVEVVDTSGVVLPVSKGKIPKMGSLTTRCTEPGKSFTKKIVVDQIAELPRPGVYHIRVSHRDALGGTTVWSNTISVTMQ